jgi:hypothetical protein
VTGFDLAERLIEVAHGKIAEHARPPRYAPPLFQSALPDRWVRHHHRRLADRLERVRGDRAVIAPRFERGDIRHFEFGAVRPDIVTCCGSVSSCVDEWQDALERIADGLARHGLIFLEVEQKLNADLAWPAVDTLLRGRGWGTSSRSGRRRRTSSAHQGGPCASTIRSTWRTDGTWTYRLTCSRSAISTAPSNVPGCRWSRAPGSTTQNLLPSTILHEARPLRAVRAVFPVLRTADRLLARTWPFWCLGCSVVYCLSKRSG